jgi:TrmH family RNA methyltransferase
MKITSIQNPKIKQLQRLNQKSRERKKSGLFIIEGKREIQLAIQAGYSLDSLYYREGYSAETIIQQSGISRKSVFEISPHVFSKIAYRHQTEGVLVVAKSLPREIEEFNPGEDAIILILESPEKPGNIGAVLRTADALGIDGVIISDPLTDIYHPNIIRSGVGAIFTTNTITGTNDKVYDFLSHHKFKIYSAVLSNNSLPHDQADYNGKIALIIGTESTGLSNFWKDKADRDIMIPMRGRIDSLNLSVSAALLMYEAIRQRMSKK